MLLHFSQIVPRVCTLVLFITIIIINSFTSILKLLCISLLHMFTTTMTYHSLLLYFIVYYIIENNYNNSYFMLKE